MQKLSFTLKIKMIHTIFDQIKRYFAQLRAFLPEKLPIGKSAFDTFVDSTLSLYNIPVQPAYKQIIAVTIQHLPQEQHTVSKRFLMRKIKSAQARETAYWMMKDLQDTKTAAVETTASLEKIEAAAIVQKTNSVPAYSTNV